MSNAAVARISDFVNTKKLKETKAAAGKYTYFDDPGEYLVRVESVMFGFKTKASGGQGAPFCAIENKIITSTSDKPHLRVGRTASMYAEDEGKQATMYLPKIRNAIEAIMNVSPDEVEAMSDADFSVYVQTLFFDELDAKGDVVNPAGAVGEILCIKAAEAKNKAKEDRVYSSYSVATDDQLAAGGYERNDGGVIVPLKLKQ